LIGGAAGIAVAIGGAAVAVCVALALMSWAFASRIPVTDPSAPDLRITANPWTSTFHLLKTLWAEGRLWDGTVIVSWFWLVGAVVLATLFFCIAFGGWPFSRDFENAYLRGNPDRAPSGTTISATVGPPSGLVMSRVPSTDSARRARPVTLKNRARFRFTPPL